jgi:hypothetical protein
MLDEGIFLIGSVCNAAFLAATVLFNEDLFLTAVAFFVFAMLFACCFMEIVFR